MDVFAFFYVISAYWLTELFPWFMQYARWYEDWFGALGEVLYGDGLYGDEEGKEETTDDLDYLPELVELKPAPALPAYTDKYKDALQQRSKTWVFTEAELAQKVELIEEEIKRVKELYNHNILEARQAIEDIYLEQEEDMDAVNYCGGEDNDEEDDSTLEERNAWRKEEIEDWNAKIEFLTREMENDATIRAQAECMATETLVKARVRQLKNSMVMENTPSGNVLMMYDADSETFVYYSDASIPYRYLEVVARKFVKTFDVCPLYVDMEEELARFEAKWTKEYELKRQKEEEEKAAKPAQASTNPKKNVFAKFKKYNVEGGAGKVSSVPPPKNNIPMKSVQETKTSEKLLLKERANRYAHFGKLANFSFLQKTDKKVFNKKLGLSFADFKKKNLGK